MVFPRSVSNPPSDRWAALCHSSAVCGLAGPWSPRWGLWLPRFHPVCAQSKERTRPTDGPLQVTARTNPLTHSLTHCPPKQTYSQSPGIVWAVQGLDGQVSSSPWKRRWCRWRPESLWLHCRLSRLWESSARWWSKHRYALRRFAYKCS